jgi:hypothetical protein
MFASLYRHAGLKILFPGREVQLTGMARVRHDSTQISQPVQRLLSISDDEILPV